ncbi:hypothetical protein J437_LFUL015460 [Ladona fulva]|uniref:Protein sleepless n=1 Tax=Ladona fulva TaxID=123851 RepID=A0A8K0K9Q6_LADFU|nr:hypothetical protein J437_LFUL015460 [Ladona fulva]
MKVMKMQQTIWLCALGLLLVWVRPGSAISCYECNSHNNSKCADEVLPDSLIKNCSEHLKGAHYILCRKIVQTIDFSVNGLLPESRVIRACGWDNSSYSNTCYSRGGFGGRQEVCSCLTDNCNHAPSLSMSPFTYLVPIFSILMYHFHSKCRL